MITEEQLRAAREQGLTIEIVDGRLVISIGIDALMTAARGGDDWDDEEYLVTDPNEFAGSIARGLEDEQEDGTTMIHLAIDAAVEWAIETAEPGFAFKSMQEDDDDHALDDGGESCASVSIPR